MLHDPTGRVTALHAAKVTAPDPGAAAGPLFSAWWGYRLAGDIWIHRGDALQGHQVLNEATTALVTALFAVNGEPAPHGKWLLHLARTLAWTPERWVERITAAMSTGTMDIPSLRQRQTAIESLWLEIDRHARDVSAPDLPVHVTQKFFYDVLHELVTRDSIPWADWVALGGASVMNVDPLHPVIRVDDDGVHLDCDRFLAVGPHEMYSWHFEVLDAVRSAVGQDAWDLRRLAARRT